MPVKEPSAPAPPRPSVAPAQEQSPSPQNSLNGAPTIDLHPGKKAAGKKKLAPKKKQIGETKPVEPVEAPAPRRGRYEPYRKADPTPEPEANLPADPEELDTLDATAKVLYKNDREALEYIESLKRRTAAVLEHVNRSDSQLRSYKGSMERIQLFVGQWKKMDDHWTHEQLPGNGDLRAERENGKMKVLYSNESDDDEALDGREEDDLVRPETPPARQPSLPLGHEDENALEYAEDEMEIHPGFPAPPDRVALGSDSSTFDRSGADLRSTSDTGALRLPSDEELARISKEAMDFASVLAMRPPADLPRPRHPLAQSYVPSSPDPAPQSKPQHLVVPHTTSCSPSPSRTVLTAKRKRVSTHEEGEESDNGNVPDPSALVVHPGAGAAHQIEAGSNDDRLSPKRRRLIVRQPTRDFQMSSEVGFVPIPPQADPLACDNSPEPSSQPVYGRVSPSPTAISQVQKEDSDLEKSQVIEMLSQEVEQGESEDEEPTGNLLDGLDESQPFLPALTPDDTQATSTVNTQSEVETPAESQVSAEVPTVTPEDVFGPIVLSTEADDTEAVEKDADGDVIMSGSGHEGVKISSKSTRFSSDGKAEREEYKVFPKTPIRPRTSLGVTQAENALAAEVEVESQDVLKPLSSPKKKRAIGARARKPKSSIGPEPVVDPENGLPSASSSKPPSKVRRGRSASAQPEVPALPKTPARKPTRSRK